jgi:hypothetical protein
MLINTNKNPHSQEKEAAAVNWWRSHSVQHCRLLMFWNEEAAQHATWSKKNKKKVVKT